MAIIKTTKEKLELVTITNILEDKITVYDEINMVTLSINYEDILAITRIVKKKGCSNY